MTTLELMDTIYELHEDLYQKPMGIRKGKDKEFTFILGWGEEIYSNDLEKGYKKVYEYLLEQYEDVEQQNLEFKKGGEQYYQMRDYYRGQ